MAQITATAEWDVDALNAWLSGYQRQLPFATSRAINSVAFDARKAINSGTKGAFHNPVKFTQSAFLVQKSDKRTLTAFVFAQDEKGRDRARYLRFGIQGGSRPQKGMDVFFERGVPNDGTIPAGAYFMPTSLVKTNSAGNITQGTLRRITAGLNSNSRGGFFIGTPKGGSRPPGIYRRSREQLFPYFIATTDKPDYSKRFDIKGIGDKVIARNFQKHFDAAISQAIATAR